MPRSWSRVEEQRIVELVKLCNNPRQLKQIQAQTVLSGQSQNNFVLAKLVRIFIELGQLHYARAVADSVDNPNAFLWTAVIRGYSQSSDSDTSCREALLLYAKMHKRGGVQPLPFTFSSVLKACASLPALNEGQQLHSHVVKYGLQHEPRVQTTLVLFYSRCGRMKEAQALFDRMPVWERDVQAWNTMVAAYAKCGDMEPALLLFEQMPQHNSFTYVEMITGYAECNRMDLARDFLDKGLLPDGNSVVVQTAMISGYLKCGDIRSARLLFDQMPEKDIPSWNTMIGAYSQRGLFAEAIDVFQMMLETGEGNPVKPDKTTMAIVISATTQLGSPERARWIEDYVSSRGSELINSHTVAALIDMHSKCGDLDKAYKLFLNCKEKDLVCYSTMIAGFGAHGRAREALQTFSQLHEERLRPDGICFLGLLSACSHSGLVEEGYRFFKTMKEEHSISPTVDHYMCLVDLLGRAGHVSNAYRIIKEEMPPLKPHVGVWGALLSACRTYSNLELGEEAGKHLLELEPENSGNYVLLAGLYAKAGRWDDVAKVRAVMRTRVRRKTPGCSWIEVNGVTRRFLTGELWDQLEDTVVMLTWDLKLQGYLQSLDDEE